MKREAVDPVDLHFHDLRRSAHYQMRKAGIDGQTRRDIVGHMSTSMDDRYTMIDDEAFEDARRKMDVFQAGRGLIGSKNCGYPGYAPFALPCATLGGRSYPYS
jgi:hypothetical protein